MGLFSSLFKSTPTVLEFKPRSIQEAYISVLYPVIAADGDFGSEETSSLARIAMQTGLFSDVDMGDLILGATINLDKFGAKPMIEAGFKMINQKSKPQLFCFCADLILSDGVVTDEEEKILEYLSKVSAISEDTAKKIIEVSMIRAGM
jgi:tellurite resistance protein